MTFSAKAAMERAAQEKGQAWLRANQLHDKMVDDLPSVEELAEQILAGKNGSSEAESEPAVETEETETEYQWYQKCETNSGGRDLFSWKYTVDTSFKHFRKAAAKDHALTLALFDMSDTEIFYTITAEELAAGLKNHKLKVVVPAVQGAKQRLDGLKREHPSWLIEFGRQTSGSNTTYIEIPVTCVRKQLRPPAEELEL